ncbi:hypothetical protein [Streptomyces sp. NPDC047071]|uniref:hypothetical protein n=1 Tax=Streptomyces sp. NPDC047071 TaxID=3154808 RepID=UPI00345187E8
MSKRRQGTRSAAGRVAPLLVLRCAALFAVLVWMLPVCGHASNGAAPAPVVSAAPQASGTTSLATSTNVLSGRGHACPDTEHRPGDAHCRPVSRATVATSSPAPVPVPLSADVTAAPWAAAESTAARGAPADPAPAPGIHQLQVQRT